MVIDVKVTIADVAKKAGVSKTTVSRILNGNFKHNTEDTIATVLKVVEELEYRPNALAKGLKSMKTNVIGIVLSNFKNDFWFNVLEGVEDTCKNKGYNLMICNSDGDFELEEQYIREFQMRQVDGIIINPTAENFNLYEELANDNYPMVVMNRKLPNINAHHVVVNNVKGGFLATNHLLENGRKHIVALTYKNENISTWKERIEGYQDALKEAGFSKSTQKIIEIDDVSTTKQTIETYLESNPEVDAIFSTNNMLTLNLLEVLKKLNKKIPKDISLIGYDETKWAKHLNPPLTTIKQPAYELGKESATLLIEGIQQKGNNSIKNIIFQPELLVRESSTKLSKD